MTGQKERILNYLDTQGSITQKQAMDDLGIARLASRMDELRKLGYPIVTEVETGVNRFGERTRWARYRMGARV